MKLYTNKKHKNISIITTVLMCILFMGIMPYGSFNPGTYGFWLCIVLGLSIGFTTDFLMAKMRQKAR